MANSKLSLLSQNNGYILPFSVKVSLHPVKNVGAWSGEWDLVIKFNSYEMRSFFYRQQHNKCQNRRLQARRAGRSIL